MTISPFTGFMAFCMIWWVVLFIVLPMGVKPDETPRQGNDPGAPTNPHIWRKLGITTLISSVLVLIYGAVVLWSNQTT